ncbi:hypothetical protein SAMN02745121_07239 [Nannocystis exedens]|uniref:Uncharacterized protein n=1 Tax=Nannocystis exedens TaxID=54 RepID=A0A1I2GGI2_9BACT|nr:hypothetical protein [Nannocystis exedens]PCC69985.1 hypothetical protein NAEX_03013 [Nannocystis exedens]SFF15977.1 hypothetical protein SAMN02745121_07239 [Nannocystis exedens]
MDLDATTPPGRARVALAWRVGLRPRSSRLAPALLCLAVAAAIPHRLEPSLASALRAAWSGESAHVLWDMYMATWPMVVAGVALLVALATAASGSLGWVEGDRSRLGRVDAARPGAGSAVVAVAVLVALALAVRGVIAGAARGVAAGEASLVALWVEWLRRALLAAGCVTLVAAVLELVVMRGALRRALYQTRREAKESSR